MACFRPEEAMRRARITFVLFLLACWLVPISFAQEEQTTEAFNSYLASAEQRITQMIGKSTSFLVMDSLPSSQRDYIMGRLRSGEVVIEKHGDTPTDVHAGL